MRAGVGGVGLAVLAASWFAAGPADAYCRTRTVTPPYGYDPVVSGCWSEGVPLAWYTKRVPYGVDTKASRKVSLADATRIAESAFATWNATLCGAETLGIQAYDDGPIMSVPDASDLPAAGTDASVLFRWALCADSASCNPEAHDVIVFDDDRWPHDDPLSTLALTTVTYGVDDGKIFQAYTEVNSFQKTLTTAEPPPPGSDVYDLQSILTHEAGHFLGLAHSPEPTAIMYAIYVPGSIHLTADDADAICSLYPHSWQSPAQSPSNGGCSAAAMASGPGAEGRLFPWSLVGLGAMAFARRRRSRAE